jgi:hypothetical protein
VSFGGGRVLYGDNQQIKIVFPHTAEAARALYEDELSKIITTFELPYHEAHLEPVHVGIDSIIERLPFGQFAIREPFKVTDPANGIFVTGVEHLVVVKLDDETIALVSKMNYVLPDGRRVTRYQPNEDTGDNSEQAASLTLLNRLYQALYKRTHRFLDAPVSRQVRRSQGLPSEYREYIVIPRTDARYENALRPSVIAKRMRTLHAVRGHLRHYRSPRYVNMQGQTQRIEPHLRGTGDALQVKKYRVQ